MKIKKKIIWNTNDLISDFPIEIKKNFYEFYFYERKKFVSWIDKISYKYSQDIDWWVSPPASRNLYYSDLYKYICIIKTLKKFKNKYDFTIATDSEAFKKILKKIFYKSILIKDQISKKKISQSVYFFYIFKNIFIFFIQFVSIKVFYRKKNLENNATLIDTFIIDKKSKEKYYYGNLEKFAKKNNKKIFFLSTIIENNFLRFLDILFSLKKKNYYVLKEDYLDFSDILYCFKFFIRTKKFNINYPKFENLDLSNLIKEEIFGIRNLFSVFIGIANFIFFRKIKSKSIKVKKVINWFENQPMDKGFNYGLRKYFPKTISYGYQGFTDYPEYMNIYPSNLEFNSKVIPKKIIITGKRYEVLRKEFCNKLEIINGPALRAEKIFKLFKKKNRYNIVIFLEGGTKKNDIDIVSKFIDISKNFKDLKFFIKTHPILPLNKLDIEIPKNFEVLNGDFSSIAKKTFIAVSYGNTSATLESLAYGCNLIIPFDNFFDKKNLSIFRINKNFFRVCNNNLEIINAIKFFLNLKNSKKISNRDKIKNILFNKINKKNLSVLL